jgi:hypothetical protein
MRVKLAWVVRVGGAVYAPAEWADKLILFHLYQYMYSVGPTIDNIDGSLADGTG